MSQIFDNSSSDRTDDAIPITLAPAPWHLQGRGYLAIFRFNKDFAETKGLVPPGSFAGSFGAIMIVRYDSSPVGPYSELLFIPGKVRAGIVHSGIDRWHRITKIYVSTTESVVNGKRNWAIPKELADFSFVRDKKHETVHVSMDGKAFFNATLTPRGPRFPVSTAFLPLPLVQEHEDGTFLYTKFSGTGKGRLATMEEVQADQTYFPDFSLIKPLVTVAVDPFSLVFPVAEALQLPSFTPHPGHAVP
jgi:hypothetical protein